ncbi:WXG100 family type VII secretion target [Nocardioides yefusunii]|uniref:ESAT-6-like protein n=1 Tax=Nocardioides yefusunii TaxID=2500546 RepID=A0ABW1QZQ4_9ACTN|nr:WXG100 family type VII secretion target [Nocardioides yefusunii]
MSFDGIMVDHGSLDQASADLGSAARKIRSRLDELESQLAPLAEQWSGEARESYATAKRTWDQALAEMVTLLSDVSLAVADSNDAFRAADRRGAARFS